MKPVVHHPGEPAVEGDAFLAEELSLNLVSDHRSWLELRDAAPAIAQVESMDLGRIQVDLTSALIILDSDKMNPGNNESELPPWLNWLQKNAPRSKAGSITVPVGKLIRLEGGAWVEKDHLAGEPDHPLVLTLLPD